MDYSFRVTTRSLGGSIAGPAKFQGSRPLQTLALGHVSGTSMHKTNRLGHMAKEPASNGNEGLGNGGSSPADSIRGRSKKPWWAPIFKFSESNDRQSNDGGRAATVGEGDGKVRRATVFTDEKARVLRREMRATESWHDLMYHSAIASRLALPDDDSAAW